MENPTLKPLKLDPFNNGSLLEGLFIYQLSLVMEYIKRGKLPEKQTNWQSRDFQAFIKKTISNLLEEMAEAAMEQDKIAEVMKSGNYAMEEEQQKMIQAAKDCGVELIDAVHFFIELFIYSDIGPLEVREYYKELAKTNNLEALASEEGLTSAFAFARHLNIHEDAVRQMTYYAYTIPSVSLDSLDCPFRKVHPELFTAINGLYWKVAKTLLKAQNILKLREWRSSEETTLSVQSYQNFIMEAFTFFMQIADAMHMTPQMLYSIYETKNQIVQQRIANGY